MSTTPILSTIAVLGGTGKEGKGLAYRWAKAGYRVLIGSRTPDKAKATAMEILGLLGEKPFGIDKKALEIVHMTDKKFFSTKLISTDKYSYADVSIFWYTHYSPEP